MLSLMALPILTRAFHSANAVTRSRIPSQMILRYTQLVTDTIKQGWSCYLVTVLFAQLPASRSAIISRMKQEVQRVYSTLITRVHRKPRTASPNKLPILIGAVDLPVYKSIRTSARQYAA